MLDRFFEFTVERHGRLWQGDDDAYDDDELGSWVGPTLCSPDAPAFRAKVESTVASDVDRV
jgi:hypothetical protein